MIIFVRVCLLLPVVDCNLSSASISEATVLRRYTVMITIIIYYCYYYYYYCYYYMLDPRKTELLLVTQCQNLN